MPSWPAFILGPGATVAHRHWKRVLGEFSEFQVVLVDEGTDEVVGVGHSLPLRWDFTDRGLPAGWDAAVEQAIHDHDDGREPTVSVALSITVATPHQHRGLSPRLVQALRDVAATHGLRGMVAPVRPTRKAEFPYEPMEDYTQRLTPAGEPFDPWLRVHWRLGGQIRKVCPESMRITGTVTDWQAWTGRSFRSSGSYVVPGALVPVRIDRRRNRGTYVEPNVWVYHADDGVHQAPLPPA